MKETSVYVVYCIDNESDDFDIIEVFEDYYDAKRYMKESDKDCRLWQRPLVKSSLKALKEGCGF